MIKHQVTITQVYRTVRSITIELEADTADVAVEQQAQDDAPAYDDPRWVELRTLQHEQVEPAE
jgi:hypothetical protein